MSGTSNSDFTFDFSKFLPAVNQTNTLVKFFGATVNQLFQPGDAKTISGYIGQVPLYNDANTDFYVQEPSDERSAYQLEPTMVSLEQSSTTASSVSNALTYPDFVSYLMNTSAVTTFQPRLFENEFYTWAPPIDIDKIVNFNQYLWIGSVGEANNGNNLDTSTLPALIVSTPVTSYSANSGQSVFATTAPVPGLPLQPAAYVNGTKVSGTYQSSNNTYKLSSRTRASDNVVVTLHDSLGTNIKGLVSIDLSPMANYYVEYKGDGFTTTFKSFQNVTVANNSTVTAVYVNGLIQGYLNNSGFSYVGGSNGFPFTINSQENPTLVVFEKPLSGQTSFFAADVVTIITYNGLYSVINEVPPAELNTTGIAVLQPKLTSGLIAKLYDCKSQYSLNGEFSSYFIDNVGIGSRLTNVSDMIFVTNPQYQTIDRCSVDSNSWSLHNFWVHQDSYSWSGIPATATRASRPIIEFIKDMVLYKYGNQRIQVDALMTQSTASYISGGQVTKIPFAKINSKRIGSVAVDNGSIFIAKDSMVTESGNLEDFANEVGEVYEQNNAEDVVELENMPGGMIEETMFPQDSTDIGRGLNGFILRSGMTLLVINEFINQLFSVTNDGSGNILLTPINNSVEGQYFTTPEFSVFEGHDIHYDSTTLNWVVGGNQEWIESVAPLFYLYNADATGIPLDDSSMYTGSNFSGSEIFSYATGVGNPDTVLLQPLKYDKNGYIIFDNKTVNERYTYNGGEITGLYCYGLYIIENNTAVYEIGSVTDNSDSFVSNSPPMGMRHFAEKNNFFTPVNAGEIAENMSSHDAVNALSGQYVSEYMDAEDFVDVLGAIVPSDTSSIFYKTYSLWLKAPQPSQQSLGSSFPSVPPNLQANPLSEDVGYVSLSDWYLQFTEILENQNGFSGNTFSGNNYRDTERNLSLGSEIVQHQSPMLKSMLLSSAEEFDVPNAIRFAENEYKKFKNKFSLKIVSLASRGVLDNGISDITVNPNDPVNWTTPPLTWAITALNEIKASYNSSFPFSLSTMAGGNYFIPPTPAFLGIIPPTTPTFVVDNTYSKQQCFIRGHDGSYLPAFGTFALTQDGYISSDWRDHIFLALETLIYQNIPSVIKNTGNSSNFIQERLNFDVFQWMDNVFFTNPLSYGYSRTEINYILISSFEQWVQQGRFDYRTYGGYDQNNPFTWNYNGTLDKFGNNLPGNWRAIYQWYYDTDHPHIRPWEMLGFAEMPNWWIGVYGTDWSSANTILWHDLEDGFVAEGPRSGVNERYARPGLSLVIPVDSNGNLLDPLAAHIVPVRPTQANATKDWVFGDWGPVETQWRNSSSYRFALSELGFLIKPPQFIEICWDTINYGYSGEQWVNLNPKSSEYLNRPISKNDLIHGELDKSGNSTVVIGVQQWIVDGLVNIGKAAALLGNAIRNLDVRLAHRIAGFVSSDGLKAVSDTFGLLPSEDVQIALYNAPAFDTETYTGVIVEYAGNGYRVTGYDKQNQYFTVFPPNTSGPKGLITIGNNPEPLSPQWRGGTFYTVNMKVLYEGYVYQCTKSHTSSNIFDLTYWTILGQQPKVTPRVTSYSSYSKTAVQIPYGTVLPNAQSVSDFLLGLQTWQVSRGWVFNQIDQATSLTRDWSLAVKEFLEWSQVTWSPGNFVALSPGAENLNFVSNYGTVLNVEDAVTGFFGLLDRSGNPITSRSAYISRLGSQITLQASNADIYSARLRIAEVEHILVFSNTTIFDDILYIPLFNLRQARLKMIANVSTNWNGRLTAPGFMLVGNDLVPNFEKNAEDIRTMFDIEKTDRTEFLSYARHNIGYQARSYMEDLLLSETEQFEFFQGMIQAKGSPSVFERLLRSTRINENSDIEFLEEWAIRQSKYGAPINPRITLTLPQNDVRSDPQLIIFDTIDNASPIWIEVPVSPLDSRWLDSPKTQTFPPVNTNAPMLPSAGPVRLSEVQYTSFSPSNLQGYFETAYNNNLSVFNTSERVWVYDVNGSWDVWRVFDIASVPNYITSIVVPSIDPTVNGMRIYFQYPLTISERDIGSYIVIDNSTLSTPDLLGIQVITNFDYAGQWIEVDQQGSSGYVFDGTTVYPKARIFRSVRFANTEALNASIVYAISENANITDFADQFYYDTLNDYMAEDMNASDTTGLISLLNESYWIVGDFVWIDDDSQTGKYAVRQWNGTQFNIIRNQPVKVDPASIVNSTVYEAGSKIVNSAPVFGQQNSQNAQLVSDQPLVDNLTVIDPVAGFVAGLAEREISYKSDVDPAMYNVGDILAANPWGAAEVGQVWWDLSICRFLETYTDLLGVSNERDIAEIKYRSQNWAMIAPNTSIDVYEWVESSVSPQGWNSLSANDTTGQHSGTVYRIDAYVQKMVYSAKYGNFVSVYYFWVKDRTIVPNVSFRNIDISTVASVLTNPSATGTPWIAPIMPNGLLVSGIQSYLDNISSTLMVETSNGTEQKTHSEWVLIEQKDALSLPPVWLLRKMRDSLGGFEQDLSLLPDPQLSTYRSTGIYQGQNMFEDAPQGLLDARQSYVGIINNIFARLPINSINASGVAALNISDTTTSLDNPYLYWTKQYNYDPIIPPPSNEYSIVVYSSDQRNFLILTEQFQTALKNNSSPIRVLIDGTNTENPFWSIWVFDPATVNVILKSRPPNIDPTTFLYENAERAFVLATAYDATAATYANMIAGVISGSIANGSRIFVQADETADGFWTIYVHNNNSYTPFRSQLFRTNDFIESVDWYAQNIDIGGNTVSYSASSPPTVSYATVALRDQNEGTTNQYTLPQNLFVSVVNIQNNTFTWYRFDTTVAASITVDGVSRSVYTGWTIVASSGGTIALSNAFFEKFSVNGNYFDRFAYGLSLPPVLFENLIVNGNSSPIPVVFNRDGSWEIRVLFDLISANVLTGAQINEMFFSMIHFIHTQQNSVDWIFKTSFMTIGGFAIPLTKTGILLEDPTSDLINYVNEVKPYRVKIRDYSQQYSLGIDQINARATDFDLPVYYDNVSKSYKSIYATIALEEIMVNGVNVLTPVATFVDNNGNALTTLPSQLSQEPFEDWYNNFLTSDNVRSITVKLLFDRVVGEGYSGYDIPPYSTEGYDDGTQYGTVHVPWVTGKSYNVGDQVNYNNNNYQCKIDNDNATFVLTDWTLLDSALVNETAAYRIANYYNATAINQVLTFSYGSPDVMNIRQKGNEIDGTQPIVGDFDIAGLDTEGFDLTALVPQSSIVDGGSLDSTQTNYDVSLNAPIDNTDGQNARSVSDTQTITLPNGSTVTIPLGGIADPWGYGLRDPYLDADVPEERIPLIIDDTLLLNVTTKSIPGAPIHSAKVYDISESNSVIPTNFAFDVIPESAQSVLVFRDGLLAVNGMDYTVDQLGRSALVNIVDGSTKHKTIHVHAIGNGSNLPLNSQLFLSAPASQPTRYELNVSVPISAKAQLGVTVSGNRTTAFSVGQDNKSIVFNSAPPVGADISVRQYQVSQGNEACLINVQTLPYNAQKSWQLNVNDSETFPEYVGTMIFVNGELLMPPLTYYGQFASQTSAITMDGNSPTRNTKYIVYWLANGATWQPNTTYRVGKIVNYENINYVCTTANTSNVFDVDNWALETPTQYSNPIPIITQLNQTGGSPNDPQFAFLGNQLVSQNRNFVSQHVSVTLLVGNEYTLNGSQLKISAFFGCWGQHPSNKFPKLLCATNTDIHLRNKFNWNISSNNHSRDKRIRFS